MNGEHEIALLRRYEPIIRFTRGERFFPMCVEKYVDACSLWAQPPGKPATCLVSDEDLTLEVLSQPYTDQLGTVRFLKIAEPLSVTEMAAYTFQTLDKRSEFKVGRGRLARVGYLSRLVDALFSIALLARGRVPGDSAAAADLIYGRILRQGQIHRYYGRVVEQNGWLVLQYWFLYLFNNWRSGFSGTNDHESDWEMICIYLSKNDEGEINPQWVAYASHDYAGDDLRRRWDDPELEKKGEHPIVYAGAGSHASYFSAGEYLTELNLPFLDPVVRITERLQKFWFEQLRQYGGEQFQAKDQDVTSIFRIPFVDYARGDGIAIGPGQERTWATPGLLNPVPGWVKNYRGLWGLYTRDPFAGEDAPAGPMYNRDGSVRHAWHDPVGWAGLDKVPPPHEVLDTVQAQISQIQTRQARLEAEVEEMSGRLKGLGVEAAAMRDQPHMKPQFELHQEEIETLSLALKEVQDELASDHSLLESLLHYQGRLRAGEPEPARAHIKRGHHPTSVDELRVGRLAEVWAAASVGLLLIGFVVLAFVGQEYLTFWAIVVVALFVFVEATFRGRIIRLVTNVTIGLAIISSLVIFYEFFWQIVSLALLVAGGYILLDNLQELRG
ncbi:MAG: hypothetical protein R3264_14515 [Anaerolineae bacterium]|nr:hypothetical protein [Anaerolineae bacterium]